MRVYLLRTNKTGREKILVARQLRRKQTDAESKLWAELRKIRSNNIRFRRQHPIGDYIVDFVCLKNRLIIEIDGGHHNLDEKIMRDELRAKWLANEGYRVLRFWNNDVLTNINGVIMRILEEI